MLLPRILVRLIVVSNMSIRESRNINMHVNGNKFQIYLELLYHKEGNREKERDMKP